MARATTLAIGIEAAEHAGEDWQSRLRWRLNYNRFVAVAIGGATGLVEPIAASWARRRSRCSGRCCRGVGIAAGAMIFVISNEIVPETHRHGHEGMATTGLMVGVVVMMVLDVVFS
jgi:ZIP family zinc transporter